MLGPEFSLDSRHRSINGGRRGKRGRVGRRGMHGNHQNWKGNKGVPEGAPLSLHGGCLATPASRPLPAPSLLTPSALTPSQPFPPNHRRSPRRALSYPLHFFFSPLFPPPSFAYPYSGIPMLSFSPVAQSPDLASLELPLTPTPTPYAPSPHPPVFSITLFSVRRCMHLRRNPRVLFPSRKLRFSALPLAAPAAREGVSSSSASVAHFPHLFSPFLHLIPPPSRFLASQKPLSPSLPSSLSLSIYLSPSLLSYRETR